MASEVLIYVTYQHKRSVVVGQAMLHGIKKVGDRAVLRDVRTYKRPEGSVAVFYGLADGCRRVFREYVDAGLKAVYVDLGYWKRKDGGNFAGYHKLSVNYRHPTEYFQARPKTIERAKSFGLEVKPWRAGGTHILLAGMSPKGSRAEGFAPSQWETRAVRTIKEQTKRPIVYRPKPKWDIVPKIPGTLFRAGESLEQALQDCFAVVAHHSNVAVDALLEGIPAFVAEGVAMPMALTDLRKIEEPLRPENREQWVADLAWTQWSVAEMQEGSAWRYLKDDGLVP